MKGGRLAVKWVRESVDANNVCLLSSQGGSGYFGRYALPFLISRMGCLSLNSLLLQLHFIGNPPFGPCMNHNLQGPTPNW